MNDIKITKDEFISYLDEIERAMNFQNSINKIYEKYGVGLYDNHPDCIVSLITLLNKVMHVQSQDKYIEKFCYDTNFGKKKNIDPFLDKDLNEVEIKSSGELYDLLISL